MNVQIVLENEDHIGHNIKINVPNVTVEDEDEAVVRLPEGFDRDTLRLTCLTCDCVLLPREDFNFEEREPWQG